MTAAEVDISEDAPTGLYRLYDVTGLVIYIGISDDPVDRVKQHARDQPWWPEVTRKTVAWYGTRTAAEIAETIAIGLEQPRYNKAKRYVRLPEQEFPAGRSDEAPESYVAWDLNSFDPDGPERRVYLR